MQNYLYLLIGLSISIIMFVFYYKKTSTINDGIPYQDHVLKLLILISLVLNFLVGYYEALNGGFAHMGRAMVGTSDIVLDMGNTSLGWIIYELNNIFFMTDSWWFIQQAIEFINEHPSSLVYQELFFNEHRKFQYPTTSLLFFDFIKSNTVFEWGTLYNLFNFISVLTLPFFAWINYRLYYRENRQQLFIDKISDLKKFLPLIAMFLLTLLFYPNIISIYLGQVQTWLVVLAAWAILSFANKKFMMAGVLLAICTTVKPQWALIFIWAALRKQWSMFVSGMIVLLISVILAIYFYGVNNFFDYLNTLSYISKHGESFWANQSINGLMNRLLFNGNNLQFLSSEFPPYHPVVYYTTLVTSIIIIGLGLFWRFKKTPNEIDLSIIILALTLASPIAWNHHYGILLPILSIVFYYGFKLQPFGKNTLIYLLIAFAFTTQNLISLTNQFAPTAWNFLQSSMLFGVIFVFYILLIIAKKSD